MLLMMWYTMHFIHSENCFILQLHFLIPYTSNNSKLIRNKYINPVFNDLQFNLFYFKLFIVHG